jgi:hypothetical protein
VSAKLTAPVRTASQPAADRRLPEQKSTYNRHQLSEPILILRTDSALTGGSFRLSFEVSA